MSRYGLPDYGMYAALENMGNLVDYGELAARLGSIATFNREGNIVFWDDFEHTPLKWTTDTSNPNSTVGLSDKEVLSGGQCVELVTGIHLGYETGIERTFPCFTTGKQGMEIGFSNELKEYRFYVEVFIREVTHYYRVRVRINFGLGKIELWADDSQWHEIATGIELTDTKNLFHYFKVVVDTGERRYTRIMLDRNEYNVEEYNMLKYVGATGESFEIKYYIRNYISTVCKMYLDNFILTQNEP